MTPNKINDNRLWLGIFFLLGGFLLLAYKMGAPVPQWVFTWPLLLIAIGLLIGIRHGFRNAGWIILVVIGGVFLLDEQMPELNFHDYLGPILIIALGAFFIIRPRRMFRDRFQGWQSDKIDKWTTSSGLTGSENQETDSNEFIRINSIFSGVKRTILSKDFKGGYISCVFGGAEIDMTQADITGKVVIRMEEVFGGVKLMIPPRWIVQNEIEGVFHGVDDKRNYNSGVQPDPNKVLILKGSCVFAGIEIRSF